MCFSPERCPPYLPDSGRSCPAHPLTSPLSSLLLLVLTSQLAARPSSLPPAQPRCTWVCIHPSPEIRAHTSSLASLLTSQGATTVPTLPWVLWPCCHLPLPASPTDASWSSALPTRPLFIGPAAVAFLPAFLEPGRRVTGVSWAWPGMAT